jgi:diguanylate cyclase (GGDEF)-like protein/PAS domain S-box-containing protein
MAGEKILIVEDDGIIAKHLEKTLSQLGYSIAATFASGEEVLGSLDHLNPGLVLMDINLNGELDGIQTAEILTQKLDIPIVYLTAFADKKTLKRAKVTDPFGYILKPFEIHNLQVTVELALRKHTYEKQLRDSETRFRMVVENQNDGIAIVDLQDTFTLVNPASEKLFGVDPGELIGKKLDEFISSEQCKLIREKADKSPDGEKDSIEVVVTHVDGKHRHVLITFSPWLQAGEDRKDMFIIFHDITEQKKMQKSEREARMLAEALRDSAAALNSTLEIDEVFNQILSNLEKVVPLDAANIMLIDGEEVYIVKGIGYSKLGIEENINSIRFNLKDAPMLKKMIENKQPVIIENTKYSGEWNKIISPEWTRSCACVPIQLSGKIVGFINLDNSKTNFYTPSHLDRLKAFANQAAIAISNASLYHGARQLAITDELTGVYNRRGFMELGRREVSSSKRYHRPLTMIWMDFDHFKSINDTHGHDLGDMALKNIISKCKENVREIDVIGRYGGDEFLFLLPETDTSGGYLVAERLRMLTSSIKFNHGDKSFNLTASFGVAKMSPQTPDLDALLKSADEAMYAAKHAGRNCVSRK